MKTDAVAVRQPKALQFGGLSLTAEGLVVKGRPTFGDFADALKAVEYLEEKSPFWKADLLAYADKRDDWTDLVSALIDSEKYTERTVSQYRSVSKSFPLDERVEGVSFSHHQVVASMASGDRKILLHKAKSEKMTVETLRKEARRARHVKILKGQASELAKAHERVSHFAALAVDACRLIARDDCKKAEKWIAAAERELSHCADAVATLRKATGKTK